MRRWWGNVWLRAGLLHPLLFVAPPVVLCNLIAVIPGSELRDVGWGFVVVLLCGVAAFVATVNMSFDPSLTAGRRALVVLLGLAASVVIAAAGLYGWFLAAVTACHGGYECPF